MADPFNEASEAIRRLLNSELDVYVIPDYDVGPEPGNTYGTVGVSFFSKVGKEQTEYWSTDTDLYVTLRKHYEVVFDVNFYGKDASIKVMDALDTMGFPHIQQNLQYQHGVSYVGTSDIRRIPDLRTTRYVPRYSFDLTCNVSHEVTRTLDWFDTVEYEGTYYAPDGSVVLTQDGRVSASDTLDDLSNP